MKFSTAIQTLLFAITLAFPAHAGIYKCVVDGKTIFSQWPCADDAEEINLKVHRPDPASAVVEPQYDTPAQANKVDIFLMERKIRTKEAEIKKYQRLRDGEMARIRVKKRYAANNLAGATWEESLSTEMLAVAERYSAKIDLAREELSHLRGQLEAMQ